MLTAFINDETREVLLVADTGVNPPALGDVIVFPLEGGTDTAFAVIRRMYVFKKPSGLVVLGNDTRKTTVELQLLLRQIEMEMEES